MKMIEELEMSVGAIERYNKDLDMKEIWDFKQKFSIWALVEIAVIKAKNDFGQLSDKIALSIEQKIKKLFDPDNIDSTIEKILKREETTRHDMKAFVDVITEGLTSEEASFVHAGVTSYDIEDPALALSMVESIDILSRNLKWLLDSFHNNIKKYKHQLQIFRTHGIHAEPGAFGLKILNWNVEISRHLKDLINLRKKVSIAKISGAVGTNSEIDPEVEKRALIKLGLTREISTQIVSRDIHADFVSTLARIAGSLDKFATEIRNLQRTEILEVEEPFKKGQVGSSAMPHKRNPIRCESICSLARLIKVFPVVAFMNQNTWHERDLANSANERFILPYSAILLNHMVITFTKVMKGLNVYPDRMEENLRKTSGLIASGPIMLALANKGMAREKAHKLIQEKALKSLRENKDFRKLLLRDSKIKELLTKEEIDQCLDPKRSLKNIDQIFARYGF